MVRRSTNSSIWHLRIHSETTEFFYAAHLYHNLFSYPGACRTRSCQGRTPTTWSATGVCKCHGPWGTRAQMCTYIYLYIYTYYLIFYALFFSDSSGGGARYVRMAGAPGPWAAWGSGTCAACATGDSGAPYLGVDPKPFLESSKRGNCGTLSFSTSWSFLSMSLQQGGLLMRVAWKRVSLAAMASQMGTLRIENRFCKAG